MGRNQSGHAGEASGNRALARSKGKEKVGTSRTIVEEEEFEIVTDTVAATPREKNFIAERVVPVANPGEMMFPFQRALAGLNWTTFAAPKEPAVKQVVRDFYKAVPQQNRGRVVVRGKTVRFDAATINNLFAAQPPEVDEYAIFAESEFTPAKAELIRMCLTNGQGSWDTSMGEFIALKRKDLTSEAKAWFYFVTASLIPVTHHNVCRREQAFLIYAVIARLQINLGALIHKGILRSSTPSKGYWYPALVTMLCRLAHVPIRANEERLEEGTWMDEHYINRLTNAGRRLSRVTRDRARREEAAAAEAEYTRAHGHELNHPPSQATGAEEPPPAENQHGGSSLLQQIYDHQQAFYHEFRQAQDDYDRRWQHMEGNLQRIDNTIHFFGTSAGYDMSNFPRVNPWSSAHPTTEDTTQQAADDEEEESEEEETSNNNASEDNDDDDDEE